MRKIVFLLCGLITLTACQNNKSSTDETWESFKEKYRTEESNVKTEMKTIELKDYNFLVPNVYDEDLVKDSQRMEKFLFDQKEIKIHYSPISTIMYGGTYDKENKMFITLMYLVNNSDKEIENVQFEYHLDLTTIGGTDEGSYPYSYKEISEEVIPPKTIVPIFLGAKDVKFSPEKETYFGDELRNVNVNNMVIYYKDGSQETE